jgi:WS/DGAT/MGAT family acyltransferase
MASDRLSALDAAFLHLESPGSPLHFGALAICDGPPPAAGELVALIEERIGLVPRYRSRLARSPLDHGRPRWVEDGAFRVEAHVHHTALPAPGARAELSELVARVFAAPLDRKRALWELWLVEGLDDSSFALLFKTHHALVDGLAGVEVARAVLDGGGPGALGATSAPAAPAGLLGRTVRDGVDGARAAASLVRGAASWASAPGEALAGVRSGASGVLALARELAVAAPDTPLRSNGPGRSFATVSCELSELTRPDATVNDVLLAAIAGALRRFLASRELRTDGLELRALVPVALRAPGSAGGELGNRIAGVRATLPVGIADPLGRLEAVRGGMTAAKASPQALGVRVVTALGGLVPPPLIAALGRTQIAPRLFNLAVTNVPGPPEGLSLLGRPLRSILPVPPLPRGHALSIAMLSYDGHAGLGLLADPAALPELDEIAGWIAEEIAALHAS